MTDDREDWDNIIRLSMKKNKYYNYTADYFTMAKLMSAFGSFFAIANKLINFCSKGFIENNA